jgi:hypothetical protein
MFTRRVCRRVCCGLLAGASDAGVRDLYKGPIGDERLAAEWRSHARRLGVHWGVPEAGVESTGGTVRGVAGKCAAHQSGVLSERVNFGMLLAALFALLPRSP